MKIGLSATAVWTVSPEDEETARKLLEEQPEDVILDYIQEGLSEGSVSHPVVEATELED